MNERRRGCAISLSRAGAATSSQRTPAFITHLCDGAAGTDEHTAAAKHARVLGEGVHDGPNDDEGGPDANGWLAAVPHRDPGTEEGCDQAGEVQRRRNQAQLRARWRIKVCVPLGDRLQRCEQCLIVAQVEDTEAASGTVQDILPQRLVPPPVPVRVVG